MDKAPLKADVDDSCTHILINDLGRQGKRLSVLLDGEEVQHVVAYDCEAGWVERHKLNSAGERFVVNNRIASERVTGTVHAVIVRK